MSLSNVVISINCPQCKGEIRIKNEPESQLVTCPECKKKVPETLTDCPSCGYPIYKRQYIDKEKSNMVFFEASILYEKGDFNEAKLRILEVLEIFPNNADYTILKSRIDKELSIENEANKRLKEVNVLINQNQYDEAEKILDDLIKVTPKSIYTDLKKSIKSKIKERKQSECLLEKSLTSKSNNNLEQAYVQINEAIGLYANNPRYDELRLELASKYGEQLFYIANTQFNSGELKKSKSNIDKCVDVSPGNLDYIKFQQQVHKKLSSKRVIRRSIILFIMVVILTCTCYILYTVISTTKENKAWEIAEKYNSKSEYESFVYFFPNSKYTEIAHQRIELMEINDESDWENATQENTVQAYSSFIKNHPNNPHVDEASQNIASLNILKWCGIYIPDEEFSVDDNLEMEIKNNFQCFFYTRKEHYNLGRATANITDDNLVILFHRENEYKIVSEHIKALNQNLNQRKPISFERSTQSERSSEAEPIKPENSKPVPSHNRVDPSIILSYDNNKLMTSLPKSYDEDERKPHSFFKKKQTQDVSVYEKSQITNLMNQYMSVFSNKQFEDGAEFFTNMAKRYYSRKNVTREEIIQLQQEYYNTTDVLKTSIVIDNASFNIKKNEIGDFEVNFNMVYEIERTNTSKSNHYNVITNVLLNREYKIESIYENILSSSKSTLDFSNPIDINQENEIKIRHDKSWKTIETATYSISCPATWWNKGSVVGSKFTLFPKMPIHDDWSESINLTIEDISGYNLNLNSYISLSLVNMRKGMSSFNLLESRTENSMSGNYQKIVCTGVQGNLYLKWVQYVWVSGGNAYLLTFTSQQNDFNSLVKVATNIMNTFSIKR